MTELHRLFCRVALTALAACFIAGGVAQAQVASNPAVVPTDRLDEAWWAERHRRIVATAQSHPETQLLLIGDSIINNFDKPNPPDEDFLPIWNEFYAPRQALNLGFSGDSTAHVLWRLQHGEVVGLHPKVAVLLIGTNNTGHFNHTAEQTEAGIDAVIAELERQLPETRILLLGILPSEISAEKTERDRAVNRYLEKVYGENPRVTYLDIGSVFYAHGSLNAAIFYDPRLKSPGRPLHPDTIGQRRVAEAIEPTLARLLDEPPRKPLASMTAVNTALIPVARLEPDFYDWFARHHAVLDLARRIQPNVVMIGDSITHMWGGLPISPRVNGPASWRGLFGDTPVLNMGFGWDRTQNVLWRVRQGEFDGIDPQWTVLEIGTNNLTATEHARANTPEEIVEGIDAICREIRLRAPHTRIVLMAVFPRAAAPEHPLRIPILRTNELLAQRFRGRPLVTFVDIGGQFLTPDGSLPPSMMPDGVHPSEAGYQLWAAALRKLGVR